ncbi:MAG: NADH-quinone oxidoreductase, subunit [Frankiales bacterium]|jgi:NADH-quinone oxidoreductase subunit B|nr:NADH-quinone oxidoreductase, subunit [Frankiales bacterium]
MTATGEPIRFTLDWGSGLSLSVFNLGLACCAIEVVAASMRRSELVQGDHSPDGARVAADVLVVSGTVTDKLAPSVLAVYDGFARPPYVMSFGACSNSGGPYWDSYSVTKGVDQLIPVDIYVPGCPPRPEAVLHGLLELKQRIVQGRP